MPEEELPIGTYTTLPEGADLVQGKTNAWVIIPVSDDVDLGLFWYQAGGVMTGKAKATFVKPSGTVVDKTDVSIKMVNTSPPKVKVFVKASDIDFIGSLKIYPEFKLDDSWVQADRVVLQVIDDPIAG